MFSSETLPATERERGGIQHAGDPLSLKSAGTLQIGKFSISAVPAFNPQQLSLSLAYDPSFHLRQM